MTSNSRIAIIDGDVLCYLCFEPRWENNVNIKGERVFNMDPETGKAVRVVKEYTKAENARYKIESWARFQRKVQELLEELYCTDYLLAVQGPGNFRSKLYPDYKQHSSRQGKPSEMSEFVPFIRELAVDSGIAIYSIGCEADDLIRIWSNECRLKNQDFVIASIDKDLLCIPGTHYNLKKREFSKITQEQADRFYYEQLLKGDPIDNIPGLPGVGPKKAEKALAECTTVAEYQEVIVGMYMSIYEDDWKQWLLANGKMIHIQRFIGDWFDLSDWPIVQEIEQ